VLAAVVLLAVVGVGLAVAAPRIGNLSTDAPEDSAAAVEGALRSEPLGNLRRVPWDGGPGYYEKFANARAGGWHRPDFFPVGAWFMRASEQSDLDTYRSLGFNTSFHVEEENDLSLLRRNRISALVGHPTWKVGRETVGWVYADEPDMMYLAGNDAWSGTPGWNTCVPPQSQGGRCGFTYLDARVKEFPATGDRMRYLNLGKDIFPGWESEENFARFINTYTDILSVDIYWYTDDDVCIDQQGPTLIKGTGPVSRHNNKPNLTAGECRRAANYGAVIEQMRKLDARDGRLQPIFGFVETGSPFDGGNRLITGPQLEGAVMSELIHGARGIIYFKHSFGGPCTTNDNLVDCPGSPRRNIAKVNGYIRELAPVLNTQSYVHDFGPGLDTMLKWHGGSAYIFAMGEWGATGSKRFSLPAGLRHVRKVEVLHENRSLPVTSGRFTDSFEHEHSYHIYRVTP
jgi:hypothetical protein